jgi:hypothetical protein
MRTINTTLTEEMQKATYRPYVRVELFHRLEGPYIPADLFVTDKRIMYIHHKTSNGYEFREGGLPVDYTCTWLTSDAGNRLIMYAVINNTQVWRSLDAGVTWSLLHDFNFTVSMITCNYSVPGEIWAAVIDGNLGGSAGLWLSTDYGETWVHKFYHEETRYAPTPVVGKTVQAIGPKVFFVGAAAYGETLEAFYSSDSFTTFTQIASMSLFGARVPWGSQCISDGNKMMMWSTLDTFNYGPTITLDGWATSTTGWYPPESLGMGIPAFFTGDGSAILAFYTGWIKRSTDGGLTWEQVYADTYVPYNWMVYTPVAMDKDGMHCYAGSNTGSEGFQSGWIFYSEDGGLTWDKFQLDRKRHARCVHVAQEHVI